MGLFLVTDSKENLNVRFGEKVELEQKRLGCGLALLMSRRKLMYLYSTSSHRTGPRYNPTHDLEQSRDVIPASSHPCFVLP
jgi:hypothetical protein